MEIPLNLKYAKNLHLLRKRLLESLQEVELTELKKGFPHAQVVPRATYAPWKADNKFLNLFLKIKKSTLIDIYRLYELYVLSESTRAKKGDFLEVGVWKGGSAGVLGARSETFKDCKLWLADTFCGVPKTTSGNNTLYKGGEHAYASVAKVKKLLKKCNIRNYQILKGLFPQDTGHNINDKQFRFVHIDVDTFESANQVFSWAWPRLTIGGLLVFDDYGIWGCEGIVAFVNQLRKKGLLVIHNLNGHAILPKCG